MQGQTSRSPWVDTAATAAAAAAATQLRLWQE